MAVIRLRSLGDCVLTTPAIELLKGWRPDLKIGVVVEERFAAVFEGNPSVSTILSPKYGEMLAWRPTLSLNLHGGTRSHAPHSWLRSPDTGPASRTIWAPPFTP